MHCCSELLCMVVLMTVDHIIVDTDLLSDGSSSSVIREFFNKVVLIDVFSNATRWMATFKFRWHVLSLELGGLFLRDASFIDREQVCVSHELTAAS